jgi:Mycothiol maleylpyruvate isomerase N-terminal domain
MHVVASSTLAALRAVAFSAYGRKFKPPALRAVVDSREGHLGGKIHMNRPFVVENARERERLTLLVGRLTDAQLSLPLNGNWTIAVALAHLSFWDQRRVSLMRKWKSSGVSPSPIDIEVTNECLLPLWRALPPRAAANLAVSAAEAIDRALEDASSDLISAIEKLGERSCFYRSEHRKEHLDVIEEVLRLQGPSDPA